MIATAEARLTEIRRGGSVLAILYLVQLWIIAPILILLTGGLAFSLFAVNLGIALVWMTAFETRRVGHPLTPAGISAIGGILIFSLRPLTIASSGTTTAGALLDTMTFTDDTVAAGIVSMWQVTLFYAVFGLVLFLMLGRPARPTPSVRLLGRQVVRRAGILLVLVVLFAVGCALVLIQTSGGLAAHFAGVSVRSSFLAGRYFLTLGYIPLTIAVAVYVLARRFTGLKEWDVLAILAALILCLVGFVTGGRGPLLLGVILPLLILKQTSRAKFSSRTLLVIGLGLIAGGMLMSILLRDNAYTDGAAGQALEQDPLGALIERLTSGAETRPFDSLILLNQMAQAGKVPVLYGSTYAAVPGWFVPGALAPWKTEGANTWFTRTYMPRYYYPDHIETSISAIGEAYANFRYVGIVLVAVLLAIAAVRVSVVRGGNGFMKTLLSATLTPLFFSFIRGDSYQNVSTAILMLAIAGVFSWAIGVNRASGEPSPALPPPLPQPAHSSRSPRLQDRPR